MPGKAVIVGGGPAGLSAACGLARAGFEVIVLEQRRSWQGRVCGGFINPEGVGHLAWLQALEPLRWAGAVDVPVARLTVGTGREGTVRVTRRGVHGLGVSRETLETVLTETAVAAGATVQTGARVTDVAVARDGFVVSVRGAKPVVSVRGAGRAGLQSSPSGAQGDPRDPGGVEDRIEAAVVVMADGRFSLGRPPANRGRAGWFGRNAAGPPANRGRAGWFGWNATFEGVRQAPGELSMHFYPAGYVGVLTFGNGQTNVCGLVKRGGVEAEAWEAVVADAVAHQPVLAGLLEHARRISPWRGVGPLPFGGFTAMTAGTLLAGDAGGVGDPYMGEGISRALGTGRLLFEACTRGGVPNNAGSEDPASIRSDPAGRVEVAHRVEAGPSDRADYVEVADRVEAGSLDPADCVEAADRVEAGSLDPASLHRLPRAYTRAWSRRYAARLWLGTLVRALMDRPALFEHVLGACLRRPGALHVLSGVFHAG